jgi:hypothetical protein
MQDLHGGIGGVDPLSARTARATDFDADFIWADLKFDLFGHGKNGDRGSGGVNAALGFGGGNALDTVDATFMAHGGKNGRAREFEHDFLKATEIGGT